MKKIKLSQNQFALVDDEDFEKLNNRKWSAKFDNHTNKFYAYGHLDKKNNYKSILMHRFIMGFPTNKQIDHINKDTLDNRKINLRIVTNAQNQANRWKNKKCSSKYKGVIYLSKINKWYSRICFAKKSYNIGIFNSEEEAGLAYNKKAKELFGEYACLNKIKV